jgi:hypothetical protein
MKLWSFDARSRRRMPQALCVGVKEEFTEILTVRSRKARDW